MTPLCQQPPRCQQWLRCANNLHGVNKDSADSTMTTMCQQWFREDNNVTEVQLLSVQLWKISHSIKQGLRRIMFDAKRRWKSRETVSLKNNHEELILNIRKYCKSVALWTLRLVTRHSIFNVPRIVFVR
jgi:hypothetical protein